MRRCLPPVVIALLAVAFAPAPFPRRPASGSTADDLEALQGAWVFDHSLENGKRIPGGRKPVWRIEGDRLTTSLDGKEQSRCYLTLHGSTSPRCIDLRARRTDTDPAPGRYRLMGNTLTVSFGQTRPRDLSGFGPSNGVWVFKRLGR
jgi:uncharacterized protein (TIGR03067 family)